VARELLLVEETGTRVHFSHLSAGPAASGSWSYSSAACYVPPRVPSNTTSPPSSVQVTRPRISSPRKGLL